jgi:hypothetical protein
MVSTRWRVQDPSQPVGAYGCPVAVSNLLFVRSPHYLHQLVPHLHYCRTVRGKWPVLGCCVSHSASQKCLSRVALMQVNM